MSVEVSDATYRREDSDHLANNVINVTEKGVR